MANTLEGARVSLKAVFRRAAITATPATLGTTLTVCVLCGEWHPQGKISLEHMIRHGTYDGVISVIGGPDAVLYRKGISAEVFR